MTNKISSKIPRVGVVSCTKTIGQHDYHAVQDKYLAALVRAANVIPIILPADFSGAFEAKNLLDGLDGLFLTGSPSNVANWRYDAPLDSSDMLMDERRDARSFSVIAHALATQLPIFGVCRGLQELNVAMGGTLYQAVHQINGKMDHRDDPAAPKEKQYAFAHTVSVIEGGLLAKIYDQTKTLTVNSLHGQGIQRLGKGLRVEATAPDGLIEAISVSASPFALAVQWHPEWQVTHYPEYQALFHAFGAACREHIWQSQPEG